MWLEGVSVSGATEAPLELRVQWALMVVLLIPEVRVMAPLEVWQWGMMTLISFCRHSVRRVLQGVVGYLWWTVGWVPVLVLMMMI